MNKKDSFETKGQPSRYSLRKEQNDAYRSRILRFTLQFSLKDSVVRSWFEQQEDKGAYLKNLMLDDMLKQTNLGFDEIQAPQKESNRTARDYQIIHAFHVGDKEIVIGENPKVTGDERYMCAYQTGFQSRPRKPGQSHSSLCFKASTQLPYRSGLCCNYAYG